MWWTALETRLRWRSWAALIWSWSTRVMAGSCTNSSLYDMRKVAAILKGKTIAPGVSLSISPGSRQVLTMLADCGRVALLGCTLGAEFESMLRAEQARDMAKAVLLDACGSAWVESGCDEAEREIAARFPGQYLTDRFSPGYGDLPLSIQPAICGALDLGRRLGVHVSERFLMNPTKSVTALIGISDRPQMARIRGCAYCTMRETCMLCKGGKHCGN